MPLIEHRAAQGWDTEVVLVAHPGTGAHLAEPGAQRHQGLKQQLSRSLADDSAPPSVLIMGHWDESGVEASVGKVGRMAGSWTDHSLGFPDDNGAVTIPVGRLPARSADQVTTYVKKILSYENAIEEQNHITLLVGDPGGRSAMEKSIAAEFIKATVSNRLARVDESWKVNCAMDVDGSEYSATADQFSDRVAEAFGTKQQFAIFCGHSGPRGLMTRAGPLAVEEMLSNAPSLGNTGVFLTTGCYACQVKGFGGRGYALALLDARDGPAAVIGASAESYAAAGQLALDGALQCLSGESHAKLVGDYWLAVQDGLARGTISPAEFYLYDMADGTNGKVPLADQRREHLEMWGLFGDPAMVLSK